MQRHIALKKGLEEVVGLNFASLPPERQLGMMKEMEVTRYTKVTFGFVHFCKGSNRHSRAKCRFLRSSPVCLFCCALRCKPVPVPVPAPVMVRSCMTVNRCWLRFLILSRGHFENHWHCVTGIRQKRDDFFAVMDTTFLPAAR